MVQARDVLETVTLVQVPTSSFETAGRLDLVELPSLSTTSTA